MITKEIQDTKLKLKAALKAHNYDAHNENVLKVIENLSDLWKKQQIPEAPSKSKLLYGDWRILSTPQFPDRIINDDEPEKFQYTLGRMAFNLFEPRKAIVTILYPETYNLVHNFTSEMDDNKSSYNFMNKIIIHTESGDLPAELFMEGYCTPKTDNKLNVAFVSGELRKSPEVDNDEKILQLWNKTFNGIYKKSDQERSVKERLIRWLMMNILSITYPSDESMKYEMKRVVHAHVEILFLDDEMRITKGSRGSVVIVTREK